MKKKIKTGDWNWLFISFQTGSFILQLITGSNLLINREFLIRLIPCFLWRMSTKNGYFNEKLSYLPTGKVNKAFRQCNNKALISRNKSCSNAQLPWKSPYNRKFYWVYALQPNVGSFFRGIFQVNAWLFGRLTEQKVSSRINWWLSRHMNCLEMCARLALLVIQCMGVSVDELCRWLKQVTL